MRRNTSYLENHVVLQILDFIHPHLYRLVSRELTLLGGNQPGNVLPVSLLISLGSIETLESYKNVLLGYKFNYQSFGSVVVSLGNFETIQWFSSNGWKYTIPFDEDLLPIIARRGDAELFMKFLEFYHEEDCFEEYEEHFQESLAEAAKYGQLKILQKATSKNVSLVNEEISRKEFDLEDLSQELLASAAIGGQVSVLEWIWSKNKFMFRWDEWIWDLVRDVVEANHIQSLEWIGSNFQLEPVADDEAEEGIMSVAALNGNIEIVRWLSSKNIIDISCKCIESAAYGGNLEVLQHVREQGCPWSKKVCVLAAENGHLNILKWARSKGCPWNASLMFAAAAKSRRNKWELYEWIWQQGCPFKEKKSFPNAIECSNFEFIVFAKANGSTSYNQFLNKKLICSAVRLGFLEAAQWGMDQVLPQGLRWIDRGDDGGLMSDGQWIDRRLKYNWIKGAARNGHVHILEYLRIRFGEEFWVPAKFSEDRCFTVCDLVDKVAEWGQIDVLDWIVTHRTDWIKSTVFNTAIKFKKLKVLIWLKSQPTNTNEIEPTISWFGSIANLNPHPSDLAYEKGDYEIFEWIHMNGCPWNEDTDWLPRIDRWGDNRYIWLAEKNGGILKNADLVLGSLAKFQEQIEEEERQRDIERRWQRSEEMNDNKRRRTY